MISFRIVDRITIIKLNCETSEDSHPYIISEGHKKILQSKTIGTVSALNIHRGPQPAWSEGSGRLVCVENGCHAGFS